MTAQKIDSEVKRIVTESYAKTCKILKDNIEILHKMAKELLEKETLDTRDIDKILGGLKPASGTKTKGKASGKDA
jgi:cell division protease FtsH